MDNTYRNAVNHLQFSDDLEEAVLNHSSKKKMSILRMVSLAAVLCILLASTVFAAGEMVARSQQLKEVGKIVPNLSDAKVMEFTASENSEGVALHYMELHPKLYYGFRNGMLYSAKDGFLSVTEDYELVPLDYKTLEARLDKNGRTYGLNIKYVECEGGIYSNFLTFYPVKDGKILVNMTARGSHSWPVYVDINTGQCWDALPGFTENDFFPEIIKDGYDVRVSYSQPFRDGIMVSSLVSGVTKGNTDSQSFCYWIKNGTNKVTPLEVPKNFIDYVVNDTLYYKSPAGIYYVMDDDFQFHEIEKIPKSSDDLSNGLLTVRNTDGTLGIVDVFSQIIYNIYDIKVPFNSLWDTTGYNATRHSLDGRIVVTHSYFDWEAGENPLTLDSLAYLDTVTGELKQLEIDADYLIESYGWLDDDRYGVIYADDISRYLCIYEFTD